MKSIILFLCLSMVFCAVAQEKTTQAAKPFQFKTILQSGLLIGSTAEAASFQVINGLSFGNWYTGIGTGMDFYVQRGVPLFADLRYNFSKQRKSFFMYADAGAHFPWIKNKEQRNIISQRAGLYTDAGVGLQLATKKGDAFLFSAGYSYKHVAEKQHGFVWGPWPQPGGQNELQYDYYFNRIVLKLGLMF